MLSCRAEVAAFRRGRVKASAIGPRRFAQYSSNPSLRVSAPPAPVLAAPAPTICPPISERERREAVSMTSPRSLHRRSSDDGFSFDVASPAYSPASSYRSQPSFAGSDSRYDLYDLSPDASGSNKRRTDSRDPVLNEILAIIDEHPQGISASAVPDLYLQRYRRKLLSRSGAKIHLAAFLQDWCDMQYTKTHLWLSPLRSSSLKRQRSNDSRQPAAARPPSMPDQPLTVVGDWDAQLAKISQVVDILRELGTATLEQLRDAYYRRYRTALQFENTDGSLLDSHKALIGDRHIGLGGRDNFGNRIYKFHQASTGTPRASESRP